MPLGSLPSPDGMFQSENKTLKSRALRALSKFFHLSMKSIF